MKWFILTLICLPLPSYASNSFKIAVSLLNEQMQADMTPKDKLQVLTKWVTQSLPKLEPHPIKNPELSLEYGEYEMVLQDLIEALNKPYLGSSKAELATKFDCEYFLLHWQLNLQPQGEKLTNSTLINLKPIIKKFCP